MIDLRSGNIDIEGRRGEELSMDQRCERDG